MKKLCNSAKLDSRHRAALHNGYNAGRRSDGIRHRAALHNGYSVGRGSDGIRYRTALNSGYSVGRVSKRYQVQSRVT